MRCERARLVLSAVLDGEAAVADTDAVAAHTASCPACAAHQAELLTLRRRFRLAPLGEVPDVAPLVLTALDTAQVPRARERRPRPRPWIPSRAWRPVMAAFVAGALISGVLMGLGRSRPDQVVAADLGQRVLLAETEVTSLDASVTITEHGWNPAVPVRRVQGTLRYQAPESLALLLHDRTSYPTGGWLPNDTTLVVDGNRSWSEGRPGCPVVRQPGCEPPQPQRLAVVHRPPFAGDSGEPLELIVPVASFSVQGPAAKLPVRTFGGREALGVTVTVAQLQPLLGGLQASGNWRELYPADTAEVWLDRKTMVPLSVTVRATASADRDRWAAAHGYDDEPNAVELQVTIRPVSVNADLPPDSFPDPPAGTPTRDAGFVDQPLDASAAPIPAQLPPGFRPSRSGVQGGDGGPEVAVRAWTDGRSWLEVAATTNWPGPGLFGEVGSDARTIPIPGGLAYVAADGDRVAVHGNAIDVAVRGTVGEEALVRAAGSLGVVPAPLPTGWSEAAPTTVANAAAARPGLLVPHGLTGYHPPAVSVVGSTVTMAYSGPGDRSFRLIVAGGSQLTPPLDPDARGVLVRGVAGRYQPLLHSLEWVEGAQLFTLHSRTLTAAELLAIAASLGPP